MKWFNRIEGMTNAELEKSIKGDRVSLAIYLVFFMFFSTVGILLTLNISDALAYLGMGVVFGIFFLFILIVFLHKRMTLYLRKQLELKE